MLTCSWHTAQKWPKLGYEPRHPILGSKLWPVRSLCVHHVTSAPQAKGRALKTISQSASMCSLCHRRVWSESGRPLCNCTSRSCRTGGYSCLSRRSWWPSTSRCWLQREARKQCLFSTYYADSLMLEQLHASSQFIVTTVL